MALFRGYKNQMKSGSSLSQLPPQRQYPTATVLGVSRTLETIKQYETIYYPETGSYRRAKKTHIACEALTPIDQ